VGQSGSYAHIAAQQVWGAGTNSYVHCTNFREVFKTVSEARADVGVVPIENTTMGHIHQIYDLLLQHSKLHIIGETTQHETHLLCAAADVPIKNIKRIVSHPVAAKQCSTFLRKHSANIGGAVEQVEAQDTATACAEVAKSNRLDTAVIANSEVAKMHGLKVLQRGISDDVNNTTRFIIIAPNPIKVKVQPHLSKTTIAFALKDEPGSLYKALSVFALRNINIAKIITRPSTCASDLLPTKFHWEFVMIIDIQGACSDSNVANALTNLDEFTQSMRVLGSYVSAPDKKLQAQKRFEQVLSVLQTSCS